MKYLLPLLLLTGCSAQSADLKPVTEAVTKHSQYLQLLTQDVRNVGAMHNVLATCVKEANGDFKKVSPCISAKVQELLKAEKKEEKK